MVEIRWWIFKKLSVIGWWICPEPHKSRLTSIMPTWMDFENLKRLKYDQ